MKTDLCPRVTNLPPFAVVEQEFARPREPDVRAAVFREMHKIFPDAAALLDKVVGLTMPSRGIRDIQTVVRAAVEFLKPRCKEVRVLTAMGTHGGGTADGEREMAASRGVTEASVGARICSSMETRHIATVDRVEVHVSEDALACDLVVLVNRIKEHTDIDWPVPLPAGLLRPRVRLRQDPGPRALEDAGDRDAQAHPGDRPRRRHRDLGAPHDRRDGAEDRRRPGHHRERVRRDGRDHRRAGRDGGPLLRRGGGGARALQGADAVAPRDGPRPALLRLSRQGQVRARDAHEDDRAVTVRIRPGTGVEAVDAADPHHHRRSAHRGEPRQRDRRRALPVHHPPFRRGRGLGADGRQLPLRAHPQPGAAADRLRERPATPWSWRSPSARRARTASARPSSSARSR